MTEASIENRIEIFRTFDLSMEKLRKDNEEFITILTTPINTNQETLLLYGAAFTYALQLQTCIEQSKKYNEEIKNSLLDNRYDHNKQYADEIETKAHSVISYIERIFAIDKGAFDDDCKFEIITDSDNEETAKLLSDNNYLIELSKNLSQNGNKILNIVCYYLRILTKLLIDIKNVRVNMQENDYRFLFENEFKEYLSTDKWNDLHNTFIDRTIVRKYHGVEPTKDQLYELLDTEIEKIESMSDKFGIIEPYLEDYPKLSRTIIQRGFDADINTPVLELFLHLGHKQIIEKWYQQLEEEELSYILEEVDTEVTYTEKFSDTICKQIMPSIFKLYEGRDAMDWVCFYHVLVYYNYINCDDFNAFNRWLTRITEKELISVGNARKIKMSYWADTPKRKWSKEEALARINTAQQETKLKNYCKLCDDIKGIIDKARK